MSLKFSFKQTCMWIINFNWRQYICSRTQSFLVVCESSLLCNWPFRAVLNCKHVIERLDTNCYYLVMQNVSWLLKKISLTFYFMKQVFQNSKWKKYLRIWCSRCQWDYNSPVWREVEEECGWCRGRAHCHQVWSCPLRFGICLMCWFYWHLEHENVLSAKRNSLEMSWLWFRLAKIRKEITQVQSKCRIGNWLNVWTTLPKYSYLKCLMKTMGTC